MTNILFFSPFCTFLSILWVILNSQGQSYYIEYLSINIKIFVNNLKKKKKFKK